MFKKLFVNGCSWTCGHEIDTDPLFEVELKKQGLYVATHGGQNRGEFVMPSVYNAENKKLGTVNHYWNMFNWSGFLAKKLGCELINESVGGGSNNRIVRTTIEYLMHLTNEERSQTLVVIGWTDSSRNEIFLETDKNLCNWYRFNYAQTFSDSLTFDEAPRFNNITLKVINDYQKTHNTYVYSEYERMYSYFQNVYLLSNLLENLGVKYLFFNALQAWYYNKVNPSKINLNDKLKLWILWHNTHKNIKPLEETMQHYVWENNLPIGKYTHPLIKGHESWAEVIYAELNKRGILL